MRRLAPGALAVGLVRPALQASFEGRLNATIGLPWSSTSVVGLRTRLDARARRFAGALNTVRRSEAIALRNRRAVKPGGLVGLSASTLRRTALVGGSPSRVGEAVQDREGVRMTVPQVGTSGPCGPFEPTTLR